jgi:hypothetical protein
MNTLRSGRCHIRLIAGEKHIINSIGANKMATDDESIRRRALAAGNLNVFLRDLTIRPEGTMAVVRIPEFIGAEQLSILKTSLAVVGFDLSPDRQNRTPNRDNQGKASEIWVAKDDRDSPLRECIAPNAELCFSRAGINKLIEAGVSTPALSPLIPRQAAAKRALECP